MPNMGGPGSADFQEHDVMRECGGAEVGRLRKESAH